MFFIEWLFALGIFGGSLLALKNKNPARAAGKVKAAAAHHDDHGKHKEHKKEDHSHGHGHH